MMLDLAKASYSTDEIKYGINEISHNEEVIMENPPIQQPNV